MFLPLLLPLPTPYSPLPYLGAKAHPPRLHNTTGGLSSQKPGDNANTGASSTGGEWTDFGSGGNG